MNITFDLDLNGTRVLTERELHTDLEAYRPELLRCVSPEGVLHFEDPARNIQFDLGDTMGALMVNLCFEPIGALVDGQSVEVPFYSCDATVRLAPQGDDIEMSWAGDEPRRLPRVELLSALVACGERYLDIVRRLRGGDPAWAETLADLTSAAQEAKSRLPR